MALIIPPGFVQITYHHSHPAASGDIANVVAWSHDGFSQTTANSARDAWAAAIMPVCGDVLGFLGVTCRVGQDGAPPLVLESLETTPVQGGLGGDPLPPNTAILVRKLSDTGGRANRGRMYLSGVTISQTQDNGTITPTHEGNVQAAIADWLADMSAVSLEPVLLHSAGGTPTPVSSFDVVAKMATQRTRLRD